MNRPLVVIVGGGASGMFAAANLDTLKYRVLVLEQATDCLQKVRISGGGRCNLTHAEFDPRELVKKYPRGSRELHSVFSRFQPGDTFEWFESRGVALKTEADGRVFPVSDQSASVIQAITKAATDRGVEVRTRAGVIGVLAKEEGFILKLKEEEIFADYLVWATGSSPKALHSLEVLGLRIVPPVASLFTFNIKDRLLDALSGTSLAYAELGIPALKLKESGPLLFTHWGLSGPAILKISAWKARELAGLGYRFDLVISLIGQKPEVISAELQSFQQAHSRDRVRNARPYPELTKRLWSRILEIAEIPEPYTWADLGKRHWAKLSELLGRYPLQVEGKSTNKDEFVTAGGIDLKEIEFKTMQSKRYPRLYLCGEILDIDAITGGFNFQACWSEAWILSQHLNERDDV